MKESIGNGERDNKVPEGMTRRTAASGLGLAILAALASEFPASAQERPKQSPDQGRKLLETAVSNPTWDVPPNDGSEGSRPFYAAHAAHRRYYAGPRGGGLLGAGLGRLLENQGQHLKVVLAAAQKHGVPKEILFLGLAESHWYPFGENRAKAAGYWQFIPGTAVMLGLQNVPVGDKRIADRYTREQLAELKDERLDPEKSTDAAMRYMASLKRFFQRIAAKHSMAVSERDLWSFAMWAYNRGPGHVRKTFIEAKGDPLLYARTLSSQAMPARANAAVVAASRKESINYVPKILAIRDVVRDIATGTTAIPQESARKHGPTPGPAPRPEDAAPPARTQPEQPDATREPEEAVELIEYRVQGGDNLTKIATWISPDPDFLELRMDQIRQYNERTQQRRLQDQLNKNEKVFIPAQRVLVKPGDTLDGLARAYCSGWPAAVAVNHLRFLNGLRPGMQLQANRRVIVPLQNN